MQNPIKLTEVDSKGNYPGVFAFFTEGDSNVWIPDCASYNICIVSGIVSMQVDEDGNVVCNLLNGSTHTIPQIHNFFDNEMYIDLHIQKLSSTAFECKLQDFESDECVDEIKVINGLDAI